MLHLSQACTNSIVKSMEIIGHKQMKTTQHYLSIPGSCQKISLYHCVQTKREKVLAVMKRLGASDRFVSYF